MDRGLDQKQKRMNEWQENMSVPFFADLIEKHGDPESNTKASWAKKFFFL